VPVTAHSTGMRYNFLAILFFGMNFICHVQERNRLFINVNNYLVQLKLSQIRLALPCPETSS
jgi:hypothetical protein